MCEITASLNHIHHSLTGHSTRINKPPHTPTMQPSITPPPLSLSPPSTPTTSSSILSSKPILPSSYPIKRLTYSEMQLLRDDGLCINCNDVDTPSHRCQIKRIVLVLPDEDPDIQQQIMEIHAPTIPKQTSSQDISLHTLNHAPDPIPPALHTAAASSTTVAMSSTTGVVPSSKSPTCPPSMNLPLHPPPRTMDSPPPSHYPTFMPIKNSVYYQSDAYYLTAALSKALRATQGLNSTWHIEPRWIGAHNMYVEINKPKPDCTTASVVFVEMHKLKCERKILIFDPGGTINIESIFDLEDKVDFKGSVMIRL